MTDDDLIARLRAANAYKGPDFNTPIADPIKVAAANRIETLVKDRDAVITARDMMGNLWAKEKARAERLEEALRELKHRWYLGDLQEKDFTAALKGANHE